MNFALPQEDRTGPLNEAAPCDVSDAQRELTRLYGETNGRPRYRVVWAPDEKEYARGQMRAKYPTRIKRETTTYEYGKPVEGEGLAVTVAPVNYGEWQERKAQKLPAFHKLVGHHVEWKGVPRFVIERYVPADRIGDTPDAWERNRYTYHEKRGPRWIPRQQVPHLGLWREDTNGPFPSEGQYDFVMWVKEDDGSLYGRYKAPDRETLEEFKRLLRANENKEGSRARAERRVREAAERLQREEEEMSEAFHADVMDRKHLIFPEKYPRVAMFNPDPVNKRITG